MMAQSSSGVRHAGRAQVAGWLLTATGVIFLGFLVLSAVQIALDGDGLAQAFLPALVVVGLVIGVPPLLVGIGILKHGVAARWIGMLMGVVGTIGFGIWLVAVVGSPSATADNALGPAALALMLAISIVVLWALATADDFFGDRYQQLTHHAPAPEG